MIELIESAGEDGVNGFDTKERSATETHEGLVAPRSRPTLAQGPTRN
jgi:hypothetical protein